MASTLTPSAPLDSGTPGRRRPRHRIALALGAVGALLLVAVVAAALLTGGMLRGVPEFPSLAQAPDRSLGGSVAYYRDASACVVAVAAAGAPSKVVLCLPDQGSAEAQKLGKLVGPQLVFRADDRLEVTMFRLTDPPGPTFLPGWQKVVDVRTGVVEEVPAAQVPSVPTLDSRATVSPDGREVRSTSTNGTVEVLLREATGTRTLLSARGPADGSYSVDSAFWSPTWQWVAADDGRILVITTGAEPVTRVLTDESTMGGYGGYPRFAVTAADLLGGVG